jgi:hypothetical protein
MTQETSARYWRLADELHTLSGIYRATVLTEAAGIVSLSNLPDQSAENREAYQAITAFGRRLAGEGPDMMMNVYDAAVERHGYEGVHGVTSAWTGIGGWAA